MKKRILLLAVLCNLASIVFSQENIKGAKVVTSDNTPLLINRALIVGISNYLNIDGLQYAHSDALSFYKFLRSPAGGNIDSSNVMLLLNNDATSANFFEGLDWLLSETKEGETVAIYFSGHGDLETKTIRQNGFLLGYDSPKTCYMAGAIGVGYVQDYLATLVSTNKAKVILFTDACRSGKLTGGTEGLKNTTAALAEQWENITKILSSQAGELSMESQKWGGGAGVFTYYLIRGLEGLADRNRDGMVTLLELNIYLNDNIPRETNFNQNPTVDGKQNTVVAYVDSLTLLALQKQTESESSQYLAQASRGSIEDIKEQLDPRIYEVYQKFQDFVSQGKLVGESDLFDTDTLNAYYYYEKLISDQRAEKVHNKIRRTFLSALQNKTQIYLNNYVRGKDVTDSINLYQAYLEQEKAFEMVDTTSILYNNVKARYLFLKCIYTYDDPERLKLLKECVAAEPDAAYAYNEIGTVYDNLKQYDEARKALETAMDLAPNWSYPYNNIAIIYHNLKQYDRSKEYYQIAMEKDASLVNPYYNLAILYSDLGDTATAISYYRQAISVDSTYKSAYINLGHIYVSQKKYTEAEETYLKCAYSASASAGFNGAGYTWFLQGNYPTAEKYYREALSYNPNDEKVLANLGELLEDAGRLDESVESYSKAIEIKPDYGYAYNGLGNTYFTMKEYRKALNNYWMAFQYDSLSKYYLYNIGNSYLNLDNRDSAFLYLDKAIKTDPKYALAVYRKGDVFAKYDEDDSAEFYFKKAMEIDPDDEDIYNSYGNLKYYDLKYDEAVTYYEKALKIKPRFREAWFNLANCYRFMGDTVTAIRNFQRSIEADSSYVLAYTTIAGIYSGSGDNENALKYYQEAVSKNPYNKEALNAIANYYYDRLDYNNAIQYYLMIEENDPDDIEALNDIGNSYYYLPDYDNAMVYYQKVLAIDPGYKYALVNVGNVYDITNQPEKAIEYYYFATLSDDSYLLAHQSLGQMYFKQMDYEKAIKCFEKVIMLDSTYLWGYDYLAYTYYNQGEYEKAIHYFKIVIGLDSLFTDAWYQLGNQLQYLGRYDESVKYFMKSIELDPANYNYYVGLAYTYVRNGKYEESGQLFLKSIELAPDVSFNYYNMACFYSLQGMAQEGLGWLQKALDKGFDNFEHLETDPDMQNVRASDGFKDLVKKYRKK
jgi:tetratricopeptide (TPR) repeat protein